MKAHFGTNIGLVREKNEDNYLLLESERYFLCAVADGMGGYKAGEIASNITVNTIGLYFKNSTEGNSEEIKIPTMITQAIGLANKAIKDEAERNAKYEGMGSTITLAIIDKIEKIAYIGNVGDSRTYLYREESLKQITDDHSLVRELEKKGEITPLQAKNYDKKNIITRALGSENEVKEDIFEISLKTDDKLLLCSDGLTNNVSEETIIEKINGNSKDSINELINKANENGGTDNITLIVLDC